MAEVESLVSQERCTWSCLAADLCSAAYASALASPWAAVADKLIYKRATGSSLAYSVKSLVFKPRTLARSIGMSFLVYFATYATANCFDSIYARKNCTDPAIASGSPAKCFATTAVTIGSCVHKDDHFANVASRTPVPLLSYALFTPRDMVTMFASFTLPAMIAPGLAFFSGSVTSRVSPWFDSDESRLRGAQVLAPMATQIISTPIHLLGLDVHHRRENISIAARLKAIWRYAPVCAPLRMVLIMPAFGFGGAANKDCRGMMLKHLI